MIISHRYRFIYLGPPKTGSTTLHRWLSQPAFCESRWEPAGQDQHAVVVPGEFADYFVFASVRHPLDREVSLWAHSQSPASRKQGLPPMWFGRFVRFFQPVATPFYRRGQAEWLANIRLDAVVRLDSLREDLFARVPAVRAAATETTLEALPRLNRTKHRPWSSYYDAALVELVSERFRGDLDLCP